MKQIKFLLILLAFFVSCSSSKVESEDGGEEPTTQNEALEAMNGVWAVSPIAEDISKREEYFEKIQLWADELSATTFKSYLSADETLASSLEKSYKILGCYDYAFEKVLDEISECTPKNGEAHIWMLYNMGYIVKTAEACFAVDIAHRRAEELAPYLDFLCLTHNHSDHYNTALMEAMTENDKPVISNFYLKENGYKYTSNQSEQYEISGLSINTFTTDHNSSLRDFVTVFEVDCGNHSGGFVFTHVGDSNYTASQYELEQDATLFIPRYAVNSLTENNVIGAITDPNYVFMSHILELAHKDVADSRWTLDMGLRRAAAINNPNCSMPFWGDKFLWDGVEIRYNSDKL